MTTLSEAGSGGIKRTLDDYFRLMGCARAGLTMRLTLAAPDLWAASSVARSLSDISLPRIR